MSNIDKHAVQAVADLKAGYTLGHADVAILNELARIALASLEAEQVGCDACGGNGSVDIDHGEMGIEHIECPKCYAAPPAPVAVPECFKRLLHHAYGMTMGHDWNKVTMAGHHRAKLCQAVDECRAAMLQGADGTLTNEGTMQLSGNSEQIEPVSNRDELPLDYLQGHKDGLEWAAQLAEANHPQTGDWLYDDQIDLARAIRKGPDMPTVQGGNSPVIPDDVRRMDWLVSKTVDVREPMVYGSHSLFWSQTITDEEDDYHATKLCEQIDAAMAAEQAAEHDTGMKEFAAMLQGAEQQNRQQNIPENIPATQFKPVADLYGLTSPTGSETSFTFDAVEARDFIDGGWSCQEYVELERFQEAITNHTEDKLAMVDHSGDSNNMVEPVTTAYKLPDDFICMLTGRAKYLREKGEIKSPELLERAAAALQGESVNTSSIPNGWKLVPIDPTKDMLRAGQSVVGFWLNTVHCYSKMLAAAPAAPQQEA